MAGSMPLEPRPREALREGLSIRSGFKSDVRQTK